MALTGKNNAEKIWNFLTGKGLSAAGAAGVMGNLYAESALEPKNLQNSYEKKLGFTDDGYTKAVDDGSYDNFVRDSAGYGLAQWTYWSRKQGLLEYCKGKGKSVGDLEAQLEFLYKELSENYSGLLKTLKSTGNVTEASTAVLKNFERPADMGESVQAKRASYGQGYYDQYAGTTKKQETASPTAIATAARAKLVAIAQKYIGCKESDGSHRKIIDLYNSHKPLARGYAVKYTDAWCDTFASACAIEAGFTSFIPTECGCEEHIKLFKNHADSVWQEDGCVIPTPGDYIFYNWDSAAQPNNGGADHVGIVEKVQGSTITVIEGNCSNAVKRRVITAGYGYIRGYGIPAYEKATGVTVKPNDETPVSSGGNTSGNAGGNTGTAKKTATEYAQNHDASIAGAYTTTTELNLRNGAGTGANSWGKDKTVLVVLPKGATVRNYGYYTRVSGVNWLYVQVTIGGTVYTGFCSSKYLKKGTGTAQAAPAKEAEKVVHTVVSGDTLSALSRKYGSTVAKIVAANKGTYPKMTADYIVVGWKLVIPQ